MAETFREYLVKLGWKADKDSYRKSLDTLKDFSDSTDSKTKSIKASYSTMAIQITKSLLELTNSIVEITKKTAYADLSVERFAQRMWTSEKSARAFTTALNSLEQTYDDIFYMTQEEFLNFQELRNLGLSLEAPQSLQDRLYEVRQIYQETNKLKVIFEYLNQWTQWSFLEKNKTRLAEIKNELQKINELIIENIPVISEKLSSVLTAVFRLGSAVVWIGEELLSFIYNLSTKLPKEAKIGLMAVGTFIALYFAGPLGVAAASILAILLLLEDFKTYTEGGNAALEELYDWIFNTKDLLSEKIEDSFLGDILKDADSLIDKFKLMSPFLNMFSMYKDSDNNSTTQEKQGFFNQIKDFFGFDDSDVASVVTSTSNQSNKYDNRKNITINQKNEIKLNDVNSTAPYLISQLQNINSTQLG